MEGWMDGYFFQLAYEAGGGGSNGGMCFFDWGAMVCLCPPPLLTPHFYFPFEFYVYITLTINYLASFI